MRGKDDPQVDTKGVDVAAGKQCSSDDAHGLLGVVAAVAEAVGRGRCQLEPPEPLIDASRRCSREQPQDHHHQCETERHADERRQHDEDERLRPPRRDNRAPARLRHRRSRVTANEGV